VPTAGEHKEKKHQARQYGHADVHIAFSRKRQWLYHGANAQDKKNIENVRPHHITNSDVSAALLAFTAFAGS
jgi:hypothetical protein